MCPRPRGGEDPAQYITSVVPDTAKSHSGHFCGIASREPARFAHINAHAGATLTSATANI